LVNEELGWWSDGGGGVEYWSDGVVGDGLFTVGFAAGVGTENVTDTVEFIVTSDSISRAFWESIFRAENKP
jgi:hypothetical protein